MAIATLPRVSKVVLPSPESAGRQPLRYVARPIPRTGTSSQDWAPVCLYGTVNWLGKSYYDDNNVKQSFNTYFVASDVDTYAELGSRLFVIQQLSNGAYYTLTKADAASSLATISTGIPHPDADVQHIKEMYAALSAGSIFSSAAFRCSPRVFGPDIVPVPVAATPTVASPTLRPGHDPATGLRIIALASAVSQIVPLNDFRKIHNEQVHNDDAVIVLAKNNQLGAKTFFFPTLYTRDHIQGNFSSARPLLRHCSAATLPLRSDRCLSRGPRICDDSAAVALNLQSTTVSASLTT